MVVEKYHELQADLGEMLQGVQGQGMSQVDTITNDVFEGGGDVESKLPDEKLNLWYMVVKA